MENLPAELVHRIFDSLDAETIFFSVRLVCRLFQSMVQTYNRYDIDFQLISKSKFSCLLHFIPTQQIQKLTLYNTDSIPNQMPIFFSSINSRQLTSLRSLTLFNIDELDFNFLAKRLNFKLFKSFSLQIQKYDSRRKKTTKNYLSQIVSSPALRRLGLNLKDTYLTTIQWPIECQIETLITYDDFTYENLCKIVSCSPRLRRLIIKQDFAHFIKDQTFETSFPQLYSLTIEKFDAVRFSELQNFIRITPNLRYLKLLGRSWLNNGREWEEFIQLNLPHLNQFEFFICSLYLYKSERTTLKNFIDSFRSSFWIEHKRWFVAGHVELNHPHPYQIYIYSLPICNMTLKSNLISKHVGSTSPNFIFNHHVNELHLSLGKCTTRDDFNEIFTTLSNVTKLNIDFSETVSKDLSEILKNNLSMSKLIEVNLQTTSFTKDNRNFFISTIRWLANCPQLFKLVIAQSRRDNHDTKQHIDKICSLLPCHLKYLRISINNIEQIPTILERCSNLIVLQLDTTAKKMLDQVQEWFEQKTRDSQHSCGTIWLGKRIPKEKPNFKRLKLMDDERRS